LNSDSIPRKGGDDNVNVETNEIGSELRKSIAYAFRIAILNIYVLSFNPSEGAESEPEFSVPKRGIGWKV
jgi:hypothetical protein